MRSIELWFVYSTVKGNERSTYENKIKKKVMLA